ncbi:CrcB family protein [Cohnella pontilimi]|uniref:Fluoride-specific ion channel FluC n=1 Tax=Cohnella pontilimi TaxID=2564100 RepID=A0A4U0FEQ7_9BACL|nr:CrcB family protein [Cohnella pontilimi]TJY43298.1 CrcB family protein [Cohnella pontilimi]
MAVVWGVAAAGFLGAAARYGIGFLLPHGDGTGLPWATLFVNLSGSLLLGLLIGRAARRPMPEWLREAAGTGFLGAFTTFSAFNAELSALVRNEAYASAALYVLLSGGAGWLAAAAGLAWGRGKSS